MKSANTDKTTEHLANNITNKNYNWQQLDRDKSVLAAVC